ncbi:hypothetical protein JOF36_005920 [Pseudonocardia parietis]|uniref:Uncharacterized protein n=1 Tax=Pseudonocardia parietis TaxID=570936 RepID=A0ABS4W3F8_9PSEU|nr:hypothetical protein [Pseudonocardia parietis]
MDKVRMVHDQVDGEIEVPAPAVPHHRRSGWVPVAERPQAAPPPAPTPAPKADTQKTTSGAARPTRDGSAD